MCVDYCRYCGDKLKVEFVDIQESEFRWFPFCSSCGSNIKIKRTYCPTRANQSFLWRFLSHNVHTKYEDTICPNCEE